MDGILQTSGKREKYMRFEQLQCFLEAAKSGSIRGAADNMYMTPQAISLAIKQLEAELGKDLLIRTKTGIRLTKTGEEALELAEAILDAKEKFLEKVGPDAPEEERIYPHQLRIGSTASTINYFIPDVLKELNSTSREVNIKLDNEERIETLMEQIADGYYDVGLVTMNEEELAEKMRAYDYTLENVVLLRDDLVVVTDRKNMRKGLTTMTEEEYKAGPNTTFTLITREKYREVAEKINMAVSNDMDFHRRMIDKMGANVTMPGLTQKVFFNSKKYGTLEFGYAEERAIAHCAIYRKNNEEQLREFVQLLENELRKIK